MTEPDRVSGPAALRAIDCASETGPVTVRARASTKLSPAVVVKLPSVVIWLAVPNAADWPEPVSVVAVIRPPVPSVIAPVAVVVSAPVVTLPSRDKAPVTVSATEVVSRTGPLTVSAWASTRLKPPALVAVPSAATALPALVSVVVPADEVVSAAVVIVPPVWPIGPELVSVRELVPVMVPAVWLIPPPRLGPLVEVRLTAGAVMVPDRVNGPAALSAIDCPSVTGPVTVSAWLSARVNPVVVAKLPSVVTKPPAMFTDAAVPLSVPAVSVAPGAVVTEPGTVTARFPNVAAPAKVRLPDNRVSVVLPKLVPVPIVNPIESVTAAVPLMASTIAEMAFAGWVRESDPVVPVSIPVVMEPPVWLVRPLDVRIRDPAAPMVPAVCVRVPPLANKVTAGAVTLPATVIAELVTAWIETGLATGPVMVNGIVSFSWKAPLDV